MEQEDLASALKRRLETPRGELRADASYDIASIVSYCQDLPETRFGSLLRRAEATPCERNSLKDIVRYRCQRSR